MYRGEFLAGFSLDDSTLFEEWLLLKREWLHGRAVEALTTLADYHERRGEYDQARRYAQQQVHFEPWREEAHRQLMRLLALDGQRSAALAQYQTCTRALQIELGVEPSAETIKLFDQIKQGSLPRPIVPALPIAPTPLVGREIDRAELADRLASPEGRLITLVGPGGIGKTRLALHIAHDQLGLFADGVHWAALGIDQHRRSDRADDRSGGGPDVVRQRAAADAVCSTICARNICCWCWITSSICPKWAASWPNCCTAPRTCRC